MSWTDTSIRLSSFLSLRRVNTLSSVVAFLSSVVVLSISRGFFLFSRGFLPSVVISSRQSWLPLLQSWLPPLQSWSFPSVVIPLHQSWFLLISRDRPTPPFLQAVVPISHSHSFMRRFEWACRVGRVFLCSTASVAKGSRSAVCIFKRLNRVTLYNRSR